MKHLGVEARLMAALVVILLFVFLEPSFAAPAGGTNSVAFLHEMTALDPTFETNLNQLARLASLAVQKEKKESKAEKKLARHSDDLKNLPTAELRKLCRGMHIDFTRMNSGDPLDVSLSGFLATRSASIK